MLRIARKVTCSFFLVLLHHKKMPSPAKEECHVQPAIKWYHKQVHGGR